MEKLPPTSYVRMVDVWLIFGQLIPFVEVSLLTIMELYNEDMERINHHGEAREINSSVSTYNYTTTLFYYDLLQVKIILPKSPNFFKSLLAGSSITKWAKITGSQVQ